LLKTSGLDDVHRGLLGRRRTAVDAHVLGDLVLLQVGAGLGPASPRPIQNIPALIADIRQEWGTMAEALGAADGTRKGELLSNLGVLVSYDPLTRRARVTCRPKVGGSVVSEGRVDP
jgi:hypothetical protein